MPSGPNACTRFCCASTTYTVELAPTAMPAGALNCPAPSPESPHESRYTPSGPNFWTRALPRSVTYTLPSPSTAAAWGFMKWPGSSPDWPHEVEYGWLVLPAAASAHGIDHAAMSRTAAGGSRAAARRQEAPPPAPPPSRFGRGINPRLVALEILGACQYLSSLWSSFADLQAAGAGRAAPRLSIRLASGGPGGVNGPPLPPPPPTPPRPRAQARRGPARRGDKRFIGSTGRRAMKGLCHSCNSSNVAVSVVDGVAVCDTCSSAKAGR